MFFAESMYVSRKENEFSTEITSSSGMENCVYDLTTLAEGSPLCGLWCPAPGDTHWLHIEYKRFWRFTGVQLNITKTNVWDRITGARIEAFIGITSHQLTILDTLYPDNNTVSEGWLYFIALCQFYNHHGDDLQKVQRPKKLSHH